MNNNRVFQEYILMALTNDTVKIINDKDIEFGFENDMQGKISAFDFIEGTPYVIFDATELRDYNKSIAKPMYGNNESDELNLVTTFESGYYENNGAIYIDKNSDNIFEPMNPKISEILSYWRSYKGREYNSIIEMLLDSKTTVNQIEVDTGKKYIVLENLISEFDTICAGNIVSLHNNEEYECLEIRPEKVFLKSGSLEQNTLSLQEPTNLYMGFNDIKPSFLLEVTPQIEKKLENRYKGLTDNYVINYVRGNTLNMTP